MGKIRINELARELEVKAHEILEKLPELGVADKKTHSSSLDDDVVYKLRRYYGPEDAQAPSGDPHSPAHPHGPAHSPTYRISFGAAATADAIADAGSGQGSSRATTC